MKTAHSIIIGNINNRVLTFQLPSEAASRVSRSSFSVKVKRLIIEAVTLGGNGMNSIDNQQVLQFLLGLCEEKPGAK